MAARDGLPGRGLCVLCCVTGAGQLLPLLAHWKYITGGVVAQHPGIACRKIAWSQCRWSALRDEVRTGRAGNLCGVHLLLERHDAFHLLITERCLDLQVIPRSVLRLYCQGRGTGIGHEIHADGLARRRVAQRGHAVLADELSDAERLMRRVL